MSAVLQTLTPGADQVHADELVERAHAAQRACVDLSDAALDAIIIELAIRMQRQAVEFARIEVAETGMGSAVDKAHKMHIVCRDVLQQLVGTRTGGRICEQPGGVVEFYSPMGVIFGVTPSTNPVTNGLFKVMLCLKTRNALILSFPKSVTTLADKFLANVEAVLLAHNLPTDMVQRLRAPTRDKVHALMAHPRIDLVLATGGASLVRDAQSSGNPCYGVGPGNVSAYVAHDADLPAAAQHIVMSKAYDHGIICGSENNLVVDTRVLPEFLEHLTREGAAVLDADEKQRAIAAWFDPAHNGVSRAVLGAAPSALAEAAQIRRAYPIKVFVIPAALGEARLLAVEKLAPVLALFATTEADAIDTCVSLLQNHGGVGHTAAIHTRSRELAEAYALKVSAGRVLVNTPSTFGMMGVSTALPVAFMLGSGTWGNNITTDAITWRHLVNVKRLAWGIKPVPPIPSISSSPTPSE